MKFDPVDVTIRIPLGRSRYVPVHFYFEKKSSPIHKLDFRD
jgi:hypothetical protein